MADRPPRRSYVIYLLAVMFVTLFTTAGAVAQIGKIVARESVREASVWAVTVGTSFATNAPLRPDTRTTEIIGLSDNRILPEVLEASFLGLLSLATFEFHRRRWRDLLRRESGHG